MLKFERVPNYIRAHYESWKSDSTLGRKGWLNRAQNSEEYYYGDVEGTGTNYTAAQVLKIQNKTNIPVSVNFLHPVCNQKLALLTQTKPSTKIISLDGRAKEHAFVLDKVKHGIFYTSNASVEIENMMKDMLVTGMGHIMVAPTDYYRKGMFNLQIKHVPFDEVILDINAKSKTLEDMEGFFLEKVFTIPKAKAIYGELINSLRDENGEPVSIDTFTGETWVEQELTDKQDVTTTRWNSDEKVVVREYYEKIYTTVYMVMDPETDLLSPTFLENMDPEGELLVANAQSSYTDTFIRKTIALGDYCVWSEVLPITEYPLRTTFFEWGGRPYRSYGMIHFTKGMQEAFDKILQIMILNGILSNNAGWSAPKGSIAEEDRKKWEEYGTRPDIIKEYVPKVYENQVLKPERDQITQLSNFYPMLLDMMKNGIEYSTGINPILQGNANEAGIEVFSSLQQYQNAAMMRVMMSTAHINQTIKELTQVSIEWICASIEPDSYFFFDDKGNINELSLVKELVNDFRTYKFLVATIPSTAMPTQRMAVGTELMKIAQSSPDPTERQILALKAMELSDIREFDEVREQLDAVRRAQGELSSLQEAYNRLLETSKQMENKYINISLENRILKSVSEGEKQIEGKFAELSTKLKLADEMANAQIKGKQETQQ